jgi:quinol monooxygenase YgiN
VSFVVIATWVAKPGEAETIRKILATVTPLNRAEPKLLQFQAHVSTEDPNVFMLYEHYTDESGYADHRATETFQTHVVGSALPNLAERDVQTFRPID